MEGIRDLSTRGWRGKRAAQGEAPRKAGRAHNVDNSSQPVRLAQGVQRSKAGGDGEAGAM